MEREGGTEGRRGGTLGHSLGLDTTSGERALEQDTLAHIATYAGPHAGLRAPGWVSAPHTRARTEVHWAPAPGHRHPDVHRRLPTLTRTHLCGRMRTCTCMLPPPALPRTPDIGAETPSPGNGHPRVTNGCGAGVSGAGGPEQVQRENLGCQDVPESLETVEGETPFPTLQLVSLLWAEPRGPHWKSPRLRAIRKRGLRRQECPHKSPRVNQPCPPRWPKIPRLLQAAEWGRGGLGPG